jgi:hypothetical protein
MTDLEFDVLDELYFVQPFADLQQSLDSELDLKVLVQTLYDLEQKGWVKCLHPNRDEPIAAEELDIINQYAQYCYLATKAGLMAHNVGE